MARDGGGRNGGAASRWGGGGRGTSGMPATLCVVCLCAEVCGVNTVPRGLGKIGCGWQREDGIGGGREGMLASYRRWKIEVETPSGCAGGFPVYSAAGDGCTPVCGRE